MRWDETKNMFGSLLLRLELATLLDVGGTELEFVTGESPIDQSRSKQKD